MVLITVLHTIVSITQMFTHGDDYKNSWLYIFLSRQMVRNIAHYVACELEIRLNNEIDAVPAIA